jgi:predicted GNAT family N-acyltransferase
MMEGLTYRGAVVAEILALRVAVLRPRHVEMDLRFAGDELPPPKSWHFGAFTGEGEAIGCLTLLEVPWENQPAFQLRGMAVAAAFRGKGVGTRLLQAALQAVAEHAEAGRLPWWCNARVTAIPFYRGNGWAVVSEEFDIPDVGPHYKMLRGPARLQRSR